MNIDVFGPSSFGEWLRRFFSLRSIALGLTVTMLMVTELRFDWVEQMIGGYLTTTNTMRPVSGSMWEAGRKSDGARRHIEKIISSRLDIQEIASQAGSFDDILDALSDTQSVMLSPDHFIHLYLRTPGHMTFEGMSDLDILRLESQHQWERTNCEKEMRGLTFRFLDRNNQVLQKCTLKRIDPTDEESQFKHDGRLEAQGFSADRIFAAPVFFSAVDALPVEMRDGVIEKSDSLLRQSGRPTRVGITGTDLFGIPRIGVEFMAESGYRVIILDSDLTGLRRIESLLGVESAYEELEDRLF